MHARDSISGAEAMNLFIIKRGFEREVRLVIEVGRLG
jgi:hypothetical protein